MCGGILTIIEQLKVKKIIIGKQFEGSENYSKFIEIVREKKIVINIVEAGQKIQIEKNCHLDVLWPNSKNKISENVLNNNSLVCKLIYKNFSVLFTGDIEKIAEDEILKLYKNNQEKLKSTILKVGHHGSKTSTSEEFLKVVSPEIALIGVGENNNFGHPNEDVIGRLTKNKISIYRTDKNGEIILKINKCIKITNMVNNKTKEKSW